MALIRSLMETEMVTAQPDESVVAVVEGFERYIDDLKYQRQLAEGSDIDDHLGGSYGK